MSVPARGSEPPASLSAATPVPLTFAPLEPRDLEEVLEIERSSYPNPWSREQFLEELALPFSRTIVARTHSGACDRVVGYVCRWLAAGEVHVLNLTVHSSWRRLGIGQRLAELVLAEGRSAEAGSAFLEVRRQNLAAIRLYEKLGFVRIGSRRGYYGPGEDALVLEVTLVADQT
jgi:ribosomal-protein-alanine N-acetyltransferase